LFFYKVNNRNILNRIARMIMIDKKLLWVYTQNNI